MNSFIPLTYTITGADPVFDHFDLLWAETTNVSSSSFNALKPGAFVAFLTKSPTEALVFRRLGFELRDTLFIQVGLIFLFRKPLSEATVAKQIVKTGTGALNIDKCRVRSDMTEFFSKTTGKPRSGLGHANGFEMGDGYGGDKANPPSALGRWPSNLLLLHSTGCKQVGEKKVKAPIINRFKDGMKPFGEGAGHKFESVQTGDVEGNETIPVYECSENCEVKALEDISRFFPQLTSIEALRAWVFALLLPDNGRILGIYQ